MSPNDIARFRRMCGQFRGLAVFMVVSVGALLALVHGIFPMLLWLTQHRALSPYAVPFAIAQAPCVAYLFGVWSIGQAMGDVAKGRLIQPTLASALRRVGIALGVGGVASVFLTPNLMRLAGAPHASYLRFDVSDMTLGMIGGALFLLGRVVDQASRIQAELDEMI
jgi:hypothetical protein